MGTKTSAPEGDLSVLAEKCAPRILVVLGKQNAGKTLLERYLAEEGASARSRPLRLIDVDPHNDTLHQHYPSALTPESTSLDDRRIFLENEVREQKKAAMAGNPYDAYWDVGGGDLLMPRLSKDVRFTDTIERVGIELIVIYMLSPHLADLDYFQDLEDANFHPKRLVLMLNAGLVAGDRQPNKAFEAMVAAPLIAKLLERGAEPLFMPALASDCIQAIRGTGESTFRAALPKLDFWHTMRLETWLNIDMKQEVMDHLVKFGWMV